MHPAKTSILALAAMAHVFLGPVVLADDPPPAPSAAPTLGISEAATAAPEQPLAEILARARALSASGRFTEAYELLADAEDIHIGDVEFDYSLGRAALDAGRPDRATLAFSRVLALDPSHGGALIDTGRAYLALRNFAQARAAFEALLASDPPPPVRAQLLAYLEQAQRGGSGEAGRGLSLRGYVAATIGKSTNVNQAPGQSQVFVPAFGATFELSQQNVRKPDRYASLAGAVDMSLALDRTYSLIGGVELVERRNSHETAFDLGGVGARLGLAAGSETDLLRLQVLSARSYLGHAGSRELTALALEEFKALSPDAQFLAFVQAGKMRHLPEVLRTFDADFVTLGLGGSRTLARNSTVFIGFSAGDENDVGGNPSGDKRYLGLRLVAEAGVLPRTKASVSFAPQRARYDRVDPAFLAERRDYRTESEISLQYAVDDRLILRIGATHADQRSNIPIYEYTRTEYWVMLRRDFW